MELFRIDIKNFRSIKECSIEFKHNCLILLGKNEAGKSNMLKAIAAVFGKYEISKKDKRKKIANEKIEDSFVRIVFQLKESNFIEIKKRFEKKFKNNSLIKFKNDKSLLDYIKYKFKKINLKLNIDENAESEFTYWVIDENEFELKENLFISTNNELSTGKTTTEFDIQSELFKIIIAYYEENPIRCNYWQYENSFLLPNSVKIQNFIINPSSLQALENIFILCNRENITKEFEDALLEDGDYSNLLDQVSKQVTTVFQKIWKDFKDTSIELIPNGDEILIKVTNKTKYSFEDRSDGFKKFISILLMLSTQSRANKIHERDLILIDEPDQSLYPTSARHLRDELLEMSKKSKLIYSTHSQYMIDSNCIDRHLIVEKKDDITTLRLEDKNAPFSNDELLRRAIGSSIFECLQEKNIIFEGWLDKELFQKYCNYHNLSNNFENVGISYLAGISGVETLVSLLILANKKFLIIADSDEASKNKKIDFIKNYPEYKNCWLGYDDVIKNISTMEDFFSEDYIEKAIISHGINDFKIDSNKNAIQNIERAVVKDKIKKQDIKNQLIAKLTKTKVKSEYSTFVEAINQKLKEL